MANPEHLAKLKEGVEAWNRWREDKPRIVPDLGEAPLEADEHGYKAASYCKDYLAAPDARHRNVVRCHVERAQYQPAR